MENQNDTVEVEETINNDIEAEATIVPEKPPIVETAEAKMARLTRQLKKVKQQLGLEEEVEVKRDTKPFSLDKSDKAYLIASGVKGSDEFELITDFVRNTGKDIEEIVDSKYFQSELKTLRSQRESKAASDATSGSTRTGNTAQDSVEYWINKGKLPPPYMKQLRRDVVNAQIKTDRNSGTFTDSPVIGG